MSKRGTYAVRISGVGEGSHNYSFELDDRFFVLFEHSEISKGNVHSEVILEKNPGTLALHFSLEGKVEVECDRCLELFMTEVSARHTLFIKTGVNSGDSDDDVIHIGKDDHEIEVGQFLYEFIILALPYQRIHPDDPHGHPTCDPEMLKKLDAHRTRESDPESESSTDPRWDALKNMIEKNN